MPTGFRQFLLRHSHRIMSRWFILALDMALVAFAFVLSYLVRFNFVLNDIRIDALEWQLVAFVAAYGIAFFVFQPYRGIVRHTSLQDAMKVFYSSTLAIGLLVLLTWLLRFYDTAAGMNFSSGVLVISYLISLFLLVFLRLTVKILYINLIRQNQPFERFLIFGAGELGVNTLQTIHSAHQGRLKVVGFVDDNASKVGKWMSGIRVYDESVLNHRFLERHNVIALILAVNNLSVARRVEIIEKCLELNLEVRTVPRVEDWVMGSFTYRQIRKVKIEELLAREPIQLFNPAVAEEIKDKVVLVTGAAGSIGSELARQINRMQPERLIMLDQGETPLFHLEQEFRKRGNGNGIDKVYLLADVSDELSMKRVFSRYKPDLVYHAAAYKHVPVIEQNPLEAVRVNVFGTLNLARLSGEHGVQKFVMVSTDKAVNPTSVMGASKRVAEILIQKLNWKNGSTTKYITTRFGNVLGSNGSVIPIFEAQIASGGPVTITHPDMKRFFMTIPEACALVLEAGTMGHGGEIFVFDMGEQQKILDVAHKMIKLSGFVPGRDIDIVFTGLRPGEKLYEELFSICEENLPTHHPKIMIARFKDYPFKRVPDRLAFLKKVLEDQEPTLVSHAISRFVPEFRNENTPGPYSECAPEEPA